MNIRLKKGINKSSIMLIMSFLTLICGVIGALVGELFVGISAAFLAVIFVLDGNRFYLWFIGCSLALLAVFVSFSVLLGSAAWIMLIETVLAALIMGIMLKMRVPKANCAAALTVLFSVFIVLSFYMYGASSIGSYKADDVFAFFGDYVENLKVSFVDSINTLAEQYGEELRDDAILNPEILGQYFDLILNSIVSILVIISFAISGIVLKIFCALTAALSSNENEIKRWRFVTGNVFAYFYLIIFLISTFVGTGTDALSLTISNLTNIFMFVYAYTGVGVVFGLLHRRYSSFMSIVILVLAFMLLSSLAVNLLSAFGVFATINYNKALGNSSGKGQDKNDGQ